MGTNVAKLYITVYLMFSELYKNKKIARVQSLGILAYSCLDVSHTELSALG